MRPVRSWERCRALGRQLLGGPREQFRARGRRSRTGMIHQDVARGPEDRPWKLMSRIAAPLLQQRVPSDTIRPGGLADRDSEVRGSRATRRASRGRCRRSPRWPSPCGWSALRAPGRGIRAMLSENLLLVCRTGPAARPAGCLAHRRLQDVRARRHRPLGDAQGSPPVRRDRPRRPRASPPRGTELGSVAGSIAFRRPAGPPTGPRRSRRHCSTRSASSSARDVAERGRQSVTATAFSILPPASATVTRPRRLAGVLLDRACAGRNSVSTATGAPPSGVGQDVRTSLALEHARGPPR